MLLINHFEVIQIWTETAVHTEDLVVNYCAYWEHIEAKSKLFPYLHVVPSLTLIIESIHSVDRLTFMVSSKQEEM